jgi:hypothetical protein
MSSGSPQANATTVASRLAEQFERREQEYALGGAIALGFWGVPRGTVDVDVTVFLPPGRTQDCIWLLQSIGCEFSAPKAVESLREHGFCRVTYQGLDVDVFLPTIAFYETARLRRRCVELAGQPIVIWDAETLAVFKMMFFRRKDIADVEQILRVQSPQFDRSLVRDNLVSMFGNRDPRVSTWDELVGELPSSKRC